MCLLLKLEENCGSDRSWVWATPSDFSEEEPKRELFAIRFANTENAKKFKQAFEEAQQEMKKFASGGKSADKPAEKPAEKPVDKPAEAKHPEAKEEEKKN